MDACTHTDRQTHYDDNTSPNSKCLEIRIRIYNSNYSERREVASSTGSPFASSFWLAFNRLPAMTTTVVVPSPASTSCALDSSTNCSRDGEGKSFKQRSGEATRCTHHPSYRVQNLHLLQNSGPIIGDCYIPAGTLDLLCVFKRFMNHVDVNTQTRSYHLVHATWPKAGPNGVRHSYERRGSSQHLPLSRSTFSSRDIALAD